MIGPAEVVTALRRIVAKPPARDENGSRAYPVLRSYRFLWWRWRTVDRWLWIDDEGPDWFVAVASDPASHNPMRGTCYGCYINKETGERSARTGFTGAWKTALSMWPIRDETDARLAYAIVVAAIAQADQGMA